MKRNSILQIIILLIIMNCSLYSKSEFINLKTKSKQEEQTFIKDSRVHFFAGLASVYPMKSELNLNIFLLLNFNLRYTHNLGISISDVAPLCFSSELGLNYYVPYLKIGSEIRFKKNYYFSTHIGYSYLFLPPMLLFEIDQSILFWGANCGVIIQLYKHTESEIEIGFDSFGGHFIPYVKFGVSLR